HCQFFAIFAEKVLREIELIKVALVEISNSHSECLYSQIKILKSVPDLELTLIGSFAIQKSVELFDMVDKKVFFSARNGAASWIDIFKIWRYCILNKFDYIILNSAQGTKILHFVLFPYHRK